MHVKDEGYRDKTRKIVRFLAEVSDEFKAAQMVAEAIYKQGCYGWQRVDGKILKHQLVVLVGEKDRVLVNMSPATSRRLWGTRASADGVKFQSDS